MFNANHCIPFKHGVPTGNAKKRFLHLNLSLLWIVALNTNLLKVPCLLPLFKRSQFIYLSSWIQWVAWWYCPCYWNYYTALWSVCAKMHPTYSCRCCSLYSPKTQTLDLRYFDFRRKDQSSISTREKKNLSLEVCVSMHVGPVRCFMVIGELFVSPCSVPLIYTHLK